MVRITTGNETAKDTKPHKASFVQCQSQHLPLGDIAPYYFTPAQNPNQKTSGIILSAPHSGTCYPLALGLSDKETIHVQRLRRFRTLEDIGTTQLANALYRTERHLLRACLARGVLDLNRPANALDPKLYDGDCPTDGIDGAYGAYISAGYGVIPRLSGTREPLHNGPLSAAYSHELLTRFYHPYHHTLASLLAPMGENGFVIDLHSMPDTAGGKSLPDIIFGDDFGVTLPHHIRPIIDRFMTQTPYSFGWNHPYAGGYITRHYGGKDTPYAALQIEVNRRLFAGRNMQFNSHALDNIAKMLDALITEIETNHLIRQAAE